MSIDVAAIRDLVACKEDQLPAVAVKHAVSDKVAGYVRRHYTRKVTDRCVQCDRFLHKGKCGHCKTSGEPALELLQELQPTVVLIRTRCATCDREMSFRVGHILKVTKQHGFFRPPKECPKCKAKKAKAKAKKTQQPKTKPATKKRKKAAKKEEAKTKKPVTKKTAKKKKLTKVTVKKETPVVGTSNRDCLRHRPFMALKDLKIEI